MFQIKWVWKNLTGDKGKFITAMVLSVVCCGLVLVNPIVSQQIIDKVVIGQTQPNGEIVRHINLIVPLGIALIGFTLFRTSLLYLMVTLYEKSSQGLIYRVRNHLYQNMQSQDVGFYHKNRTGDLMTRLSGDMDMIRHTVSWGFRATIESIMYFVVAIVYMLMIDWLFTLIVVSITPFIAILTKKYSKKVRPLYVNLREKLSSLNTTAQENISGNRVVKAFTTEDFESQNFDEKNIEYKKANLEATLTWLKFSPYIETISQSLLIIIVLVGGIFVMNDRMTVGDLVAVTGLSWTLSNPVRMLGMLLNDLQRFFASCSKVIELYYTSPNIVNRFNCKTKSKPFNGDVEFKKVTLTFDEKNVLEDINFKVSSGETVAIMGATGCGKSLLVSLIERFYDVSSGEILIDGVNVNSWNLETLRKNIGIATQEVFLFSDTVDGNIAYGNSSISENEVKQFAKLASADFIDKMEEGFDTVIGERGVGLSGGQKQRLALARALAIKPPILILDDTTSAVDNETEKFIQSSLNNLDFKCTKFIIAQRISTTKDADKILVMDNGKIIEQGNHKELLDKKGYYYEVFNLQYGEDNEKVGV